MHESFSVYITHCVVTDWWIGRTLIYRWFALVCVRAWEVHVESPGEGEGERGWENVYFSGIYTNCPPTEQDFTLFLMYYFIQKCKTSLRAWRVTKFPRNELPKFHISPRPEVEVEHEFFWKKGCLWVGNVRRGRVRSMSEFSPKYQQKDGYLDESYYLFYLLN